MSTNAESRPAPLHRFEDAAYQGYGVRHSAGPDVELARIGPGTPAGEYLRRFWHPVALSSELADLRVDDLASNPTPTYGGDSVLALPCDDGADESERFRPLVNVVRPELGY